MGAIGLRGGSRRMREISLFVTFLFTARCT